MKSLLHVLFALSLLALVSPAAQAEGGKDHPLMKRMPGFEICNHDDREFDAYEFEIRKDESKLRVEGHLYKIDYCQEDGQTEKSALQVRRNVTNALRKVGAKVVQEYDEGNGYSDGLYQLVQGGEETWVQVKAYNSTYDLVIVEKQAMEQEMVANADALRADLKATGHVAVHGIYFDTGKSILKPESKPAMEQIAKLMKQDPKLKVHVVGHTDSVGKLSSNLDLSRARAEAVMQALIKQYKIPPARLQAHGVASLCPVASNGAEKGRAKNRRVELVEQ